MALVTVSSVFPLIAFSAAPMVVVPVAKVMARPVAPMSATAEFDDDHVTWDVKFCVLLFEYSPVARNCCGVPDGTDGSAGAMTIDVNTGGRSVTVSDTLALWITAPAVPVTTTLNVPRSAVELAVSVNVALPDPGAAKPGTLNPLVTPFGSPETDNDSEELNPPDTVVLTVTVPAELRCTDTAGGAAAIAKSDTMTEFTTYVAIASVRNVNIGQFRPVTVTA